MLWTLIVCCLSFLLALSAAYFQFWLCCVWQTASGCVHVQVLWPRMIRRTSKLLLMLTMMSLTSRSEGRLTLSQKTVEARREPSRRRYLGLGNPATFGRCSKTLRRITLRLRSDPTRLSHALTVTRPGYLTWPDLTLFVWLYLIVSCWKHSVLSRLWSIFVTAHGSDGNIVFAIIVFSVNTITHEPLRLVW